VSDVEAHLKQVIMSFILALRFPVKTGCCEKGMEKVGMKKQNDELSFGAMRVSYMEYYGNY